jgi:DNA-binding NtrC family response regulator
VALCPSHVIHLEDLPELFQPAARAVPPPSPAEPVPVPTAATVAVAPAASLSRSKDEAERHLISVALKRNGNNRQRAASELGISRMTLYNKLHKYGMMCAS